MWLKLQRKTNYILKRKTGGGPCNISLKKKKSEKKGAATAPRTQSLALHKSITYNFHDVTSEAYNLVTSVDYLLKRYIFGQLIVSELL